MYHGTNITIEKDFFLNKLASDLHSLEETVTFLQIYFEIEYDFRWVIAHAGFYYPLFVERGIFGALFVYLNENDLQNFSRSYTIWYS